MTLLTFLFFSACLPEFPNRTTEYLENPDADYDQDGYTENQGDCNDNDPTTFPDADELCDGADNDCNGLLDDDPVDAKPFYLDADNDGVGQVNFTVTECEAPNGYIDLVFDEDGEILDDCDDDDRFVNPLAQEICDTKDNDCDFLIDDEDEDLAGNASWYPDSDRDLFPSSEGKVEQCTQPTGYIQGDAELSPDQIDCNDSDPSINPGANEVCDQVDNDCDGLVDDADTEEVMDHLWTVDADGDGFGSATAGADTQASCEPITGYARLATDCDDNNFAIHPDAEEVCDYVDQNCNGQVDEGQGVKIPWYLDEDGDGFGADPSVMSPIEDCPQANPAGYVLNADDCDDSNGSTHPDADEYCDGVDNNCDLLVDDNGSVDATVWFLDGDGDGYGSNGNQFVSCSAPNGYVADNTDCDDGRANVHPDTEENCATIYDDNCDGVENSQDAIGCTTFYKDGDGDAFGHQTDSACFCDPELTLQYTVLNNSDCDDNANAVNPDQIEVCDAGNLVDENCNGDTNDIGASGCSNFFYDYDGDAFGTDDFLCMCSPDLEYTAAIGDDCNDLEGAVNPAAQEVCDDFDVDEDCSGVADDAAAPGSVMWYRDGDGDGYGTATTTIDQCDQPTGYLLQDGDCDDANPALNPGEIEICVLDPLTNQHRDEDCSGSDNDPDETLTQDGQTYYKDSDGDGYGLATDYRYACYSADDYTAMLDGDCDDTTDDASPGKPELCATTFDDNCDGTANEYDALDCGDYFFDSDNDGYGLGDDSICACAENGDYRASIGADCDDEDAAINPAYSNCGLMGDIPLSDAAFVIENIEIGALPVGSRYKLQEWFVGGHDLNNDGHNDLIFVNPGFDPVINGTQYTDTGALFVYFGPIEENIDASTGNGADFIFHPSISGVNLGVTGIQVVNADLDAAPEILVNGERNYLLQDGIWNFGQVDESHPLVISLEDLGQAEQNFRRIVDDIDGDGYAEWIVRGDTYNSHLTLDGQLLTSVSNHTANRIAAGSVNFGAFNKLSDMSKSFACDVNNDSVVEFCEVGIQFFRCYAYDLNTLQWSTILEFELNPEFGLDDEKVSGICHDLDADGVDDLIVRHNGKFTNTGGMNSRYGQIFVYMGDPTNGLMNVQDPFPNGDAFSLGGVSFGGFNYSYLTTNSPVDLNGDGVKDLVFSNSGNINAGIFYGPFAPIPTSTGILSYDLTDADARFVGTGGLAFAIDDIGGDADGVPRGEVVVSARNGSASTSLRDFYVFYGAQ